MKTSLTSLGLILFLALFSTGCSVKTQNIDMANDTAGAVMGIDYRDFEKAAEEAVQGILSSGVVAKQDGTRTILAISRITNDTMQHIDTDQLVKKIRIELLKSGKVYVTTAVTAGGPEDNMSFQARQLRYDDEFKQDTIQKKGELIAPDLSLSGKIIQRNLQMTKKVQQVEYYFQLTITNLKNGLAVWESETLAGKRGSAKTAW